MPPNYWYSMQFDKHDSTQTNAGGAWGYDSEESAGDTIPTLDSLHRFMSAADLSALWRNRLANQYHANYEPHCGTGYSFGTLCHFDTALRARYGAWSSLDQYVEEAQAQDYENTRAQFEAFIDHAHHGPLPSTGTIYWQMNKGFPSLLWNLYGSDGDQAGSYFGTQEANRPLHVLYALDTGTVTVDNLGGQRTGRAVGAGQGVQPGREGAGQPGRQWHHAGQPAGAHRRADPEGADRVADQGLLRGTGTAPARGAGRPQRVLAVHPPGRDQLRQVAGPAAGHHQPVRPAARRCRRCPAPASRSRRRPPGAPGRTARTWPPR